MWIGFILLKRGTIGGALWKHEHLGVMKFGGFVD